MGRSATVKEARSYVAWWFGSQSSSAGLLLDPAGVIVETGAAPDGDGLAGLVRGVGERVGPGLVKPQPTLRSGRRRGSSGCLTALNELRYRSQHPINQIIPTEDAIER